MEYVGLLHDFKWEKGYIYGSFFSDAFPFCYDKLKYNIALKITKHYFMVFT